MLAVERYRSAAADAGKPSAILLYRDRDPAVENGETYYQWRFAGDEGRLFPEAQETNLGHLFHPMLAIHTAIATDCRPPRALPSPAKYRCRRQSSKAQGPRKPENGGDTPQARREDRQE
jgi:hypothetical protein